MSASVVRVTVSVADLERSLAFYEGLLGLERSWVGGDIARLGDGNVEVMLHQRTPTPGDASVAVSFRVADVDAATAASVALGLTVLDEPADQPWGERQSVIRDPDGHIVCLVA